MTVLSEASGDIVLLGGAGGPEAFRELLLGRLEEILARFAGKELPFVQWKRLSADLLLVSAVWVARKDYSNLNSLRELLTLRLSSRRELFVASSVCVPFQAPRVHHESLCFAEFLLPISPERDRASLGQALRLFKQDLSTRADFLVPTANYERLTTGQERRLLHRQIARLIKRFPGQVEPDFYKEAHAFLKLTSSAFQSVRSSHTILRIIGSLYALKALIAREIASLPKPRCLHVRLLSSRLHFPFSSKIVMGVAISVRLDNRRELLEEEHVARAIGRIIPEARVVPGSYIAYQFGGSHTRSVYVEIEHDRVNLFGLKVRRQLREQLVEELLSSVERRVSSILMHKSEVDIERHIQTLGRELQKKKDLPQVIIEFHQQDRVTLTFTIVLLRMVGPESAAFQALAAHFSPDIEVVVDTVRILEQLGGGLAKEASVFDIRLQKELFLRKDQSIDLHKARQCIASELTNVLGEVRDYNGGLIVKQSEILMAVRSKLTAAELAQEELLDSLFYSLVPRVVQSYVEPALVREAFRLVLRAVKTPQTGPESCLMEVAPLASATLIAIKGKTRSYRHRVLQAVEAAAFDPLRLAHTAVETQDASILCFILRSDDAGAGRLLIEAVQEALRKWHQASRLRQRIRISLPDVLVALDPRINTERRYGVLLKMFFEGLMRLDRNGRPALAAAERVDISRDRCTYTFILRESYWTNGKPVTAHDFVYAWRRALSPSVRGFHAFLFFPLKNGEALRRGEVPEDQLAVWAESDRRLVVRLNHPAPYFLDLVAHWTYSPVCHGIDELCPDWAYLERGALVCNGPFMPVEIDGSWRLRAVKNPRYWDEESVKLQEIDVSVVREPEAAWRLYTHDLLDWLGEPLSELPLSVARGNKRDGSLRTGNLGAIHWYELNVRAKPFTSKKVRRAFALAIDRERLVRDVLNNTVEPALGFLPTEAALATDPALLKGDKAEAQRLFREGLRDIGLRIEELPPIILKAGVFEEHRAIAEFVATEWKRALGVRVEMELVSRYNYTRHITQLNFQVAALTWFSWYRDPSYNLLHLWKRSWCLNTTDWEHPEYVRLMDEANECLDLGQRREKLRLAEELLFDEMPIIPICGQKHTYLQRMKVKDVAVSDLGQIDFKWAYVEGE